ncbi:MAG: radical SAM protein [Planctomycetota bacterium]|jgi:hypothetical protein
MAYEVYGGRIHTWSLEVHVCDHCNLKCQHCCTLSPSLAARCVDPGAFERDLARVGTAIRPSLLKLTGGEPLLHPKIAELAGIARRLGIAPQLSMTTNGFRAAHAPDGLLEHLDRITVSNYRSAPLSGPMLEAIEERCRRFSVLLRVKDVDQFQVMDHAAPTDARDTAQTFGACWLRHRCHMVRDGRFYLCTRPPHLEAVHPAVLRGATLGDGVELNRPDLLEALQRYLGRTEPLAACALCTGGAGAWESHAQLPPALTRTGPTARRPAP